MTTPHTSVVMVSYHTGPVLWMAMEAVLAQEVCKELIVVDNGNPADVVFRLREFARQNDRVTLVSGQGNIGFARGCNAGAKVAGGDFLLLLNPDCILPPRALGRMAEALETYPGAKLAGCYLMNPDGSEQRGGRRNLLTPWNAFVESLSLHCLFPTGHKPERLNFHELPIPQEVHEVPAISGAFLFLRRATYEAMGGMDEQYFLHVEDLDFCLRIARSGGKTICVPDVKVLHYRSTSDAPSHFVEWHKTRGFIRYFYTHFRNTYVPGFLALLSAAIMARFWVKAAFSYLRRLSIFHVNPVQKEMLRVWLLHHYLTGLATDTLSGQRFFISGAMGQVGLCVAGRMLQAGAHVMGSTRSDTIPLNHPRLEWVYANFDQPLSLPGNCPETLIHTAPLWVLTPRLQEFIDAGVRRVIAFSSTSIFSKAESTDAHEREIVEKLEHAEADLIRMCREQNIAYTLLRPTLIYGVGLDVNITRMARFIRRFHFFPIFPPATGLRQPVHADDLAQAVLGIMKRPETVGRSYNLGGGEVLSYRSMIERIFDALGITRRPLGLPFLPALLDLMGRITKRPLNGEIARRMNRDFAFDFSDARRDFNYQPREFLTAGKRDLGEY